MSHHGYLTIGALTAGLLLLFSSSQTLAATGNLKFYIPWDSVQESDDPNTLNEHENIATIVVSRIEGNTGSASVQVSADSPDNTAIIGKDFNFSGSLTLYWGDGDSGFKTVDIKTIDNRLAEGDKEINLTLINAVGAGISPSNTMKVVIKDDDYKLTVLRSGSGGGIFTVTEDSANGGIVCDNTCPGIETAGDSFLLEADPDDGSLFTGWGSDCVDLGTNTTAGLNKISKDMLCKATFTLSPPPLASLVLSGALQGNAPLELSADGSASSDPDGFITGYTWQILDANRQVLNSGFTMSAISEAKTNIRFDTPGDYLVSLRVTDNANGVSDTVYSDTVAVSTPPNQEPIAGFTMTPQQGKAPLSINLDASASSDPDGSIYRYDWLASDGQATSGIVAKMHFATAGNYVITLTVTDNRGGKKSASKALLVTQNQAPVARFKTTLLNATSPLGYFLDATDSGDPDGDPLTYQWRVRFVARQFRAPLTSALAQFSLTDAATTTLTLNESESYIVTLKVTDDDGASDTLSETIEAARPGAQCAMFNPNAIPPRPQLFIPCMYNTQDGYSYSLGMNLISVPPGDNTLFRFESDSSTEARLPGFIPGPDCAQYPVGNDLQFRLNCVEVNGKKYWVNLRNKTLPNRPLTLDVVQGRYGERNSQ